MTKTLIAGAAIAAFSATFAVAQSVTVYSNTGSLTGLTVTTTGTAGADGGASIVSGQIQITNDATAAVNQSGRTAVTGFVNTFSSPYTDILANAPADITWSFNMRQIRPSPSGFDLNNYGSAFILGATSADMTTANGYAVVIGNSGSPDPVRLVHFVNGLDANANLTNIISGASPLNDAAANYYSLRVTFAPSTGTWSLFGRNDGATAFADPLTGTLTAAGTPVVNTTYTSTSLPVFGMLWAYSTTAAQTANFDNITVSLAIPEPASAGMLLAGLATLVGLRRRRA